MKATLLKTDLPEWRGEASLYRLDPPLASYEYVIVSAASLCGHSETWIFPANEHGDMVDTITLEGSFQGGLDHAKALLGAGYKIVQREQP